MAYTLTQLRKDIEKIVDTKIDDFKNGFRKDLISSIEGEIKIQMSKAWDSISETAENKITASSIKIQNSVDRFQRDAGEKLEYFALVLSKMNEFAGEVKEMKKQREIFLQNITRLQTLSNGQGPKIEDHEKRINILEDKPGKTALDATEKRKNILIKIIVGLLIVAASIGGTILLT